MIPLNPLLLAYLTLYLACFALEIVLIRLNLARLKRQPEAAPQPLQDLVTAAQLKRTAGYTVENTHFAAVRQAAGNLIFLTIVLSGVLPWLAERLQGLNFLLSGLAFYGILGSVFFLSALPFDYYHSFVIEDRYGFNTKTIGLWWSDLFKTVRVTTVIAGLLIAVVLSAIRYIGSSWWLWSWAAFSGFQIFMVIIYPTVIAPLFNRFTPLPDSRLKEKIAEIAAREGLAVKGIYQMDASRRTRHTNAYFTGLGRARRIVLFDSLIETHTLEEICAILAHEIGHLKKNHILKNVIFSGLVSLVLFYLAARLIAADTVYRSFGFAATPPYIGLFLAGVLWEPCGFLLSPIAKFMSRRYEREADRYSLKVMRSARPLAEALKKMAKDNLSNLNPHPFYVWFHYSHPPFLERIRYLQAQSG